MVYQVDVKSDFLYGTIEEEVYVCQTPRFKDLDFPDKVYKVVKALYGLHQAPRAWYATLTNYLLENDGKLASTPIDTEKPLLKNPDGEDIDVHTYKSMIGSLMYITSSRPDIIFAVCACAHFQVTPNGSHLHAVKRIFRYLQGKPHLGLWYPKDSPFNLVAYSDSDYTGESLNMKSTTGGCIQTGRKIVEIDAYEDVTWEEVAAEVKKDAEVQGRLEESQAHVYHLDSEHAQKGVVIRDPKVTATPSVIVYSEPKYKDKGKGILVEEPKPLKKEAHIEQDEAYARELEAELNANINWNEVIEQVKRKEKQDNAVMRYQALKRKPQTKAHAMKNIMVYLKNMVGFKMDFFKGMSYDDIRPIFKKHFNSILAFLEKGEKEL
nr:uncharacterized mitochondrial protein AtMg00810-like [Tanacetum cinerariifolium]